MILGITGGSGSGKTTLLSLIKERGGAVLDCDVIYHQLLEKDEDLLQAIESCFPGTVEGGVLNRKKLGSIVFADENALLQLNRITHGAVKKEVLRRLEPRPELAAIDAIALFEGELAPLCDRTVAVTAPVEERIRRLMAREGITQEYARRRIAAQPSDEWFRQHCDAVLENDDTMDAFATKCLAFLETCAIIEKKSEGDHDHDNG